jgi:hypothetical protein
MAAVRDPCAVPSRRRETPAGLSEPDLRRIQIATVSRSDIERPSGRRFDAVLDRLVKTADTAELRTFLDKHLKEELPGTESRAKSSGIVLRIWGNIPAERIGLRDRAVSLLSRISGQERIWLHWGMAALA